MSLQIEGFEKVARTKSFGMVRIGHEFVASYAGRFGIWYKASDFDLVGLGEDGQLIVYRMEKYPHHPFIHVGSYTKVNIKVTVESVAEYPGGA